MDINTKPEVSIITPLYNAQQYISKTIKSIQQQTFTDWELIIIDDQSSDNSLQIAKDFAIKDKKIKILTLDINSGSAVARNQGIDHAKGRFIAFLDSDDTWLPHKLEKQINFMKSNNYEFTYTSYINVDPYDKVLSTQNVPNRITYEELLKDTTIGCLTAIYDSKKIGKIHMPLIRKRQDYALWLQILKMVPFAYGIQEPLAKYTVREDSLSSNKANAALYTWKVYRQIEHLTFFKSFNVFLHYAFRGIIKHKLPRLKRILRLR